MAYCMYPYKPEWFQYNDLQVCAVSQSDAIEAYIPTVPGKDGHLKLQENHLLMMCLF